MRDWMITISHAYPLVTVLFLSIFGLYDGLFTPKLQFQNNNATMLFSSKKSGIHYKAISFSGDAWFGCGPVNLVSYFSIWITTLHLVISTDIVGVTYSCYVWFLSQTVGNLPVCFVIFDKSFRISLDFMKEQVRRDTQTCDDGADNEDTAMKLEFSYPSHSQSAGNAHDFREEIDSQHEYGGVAVREDDELMYDKSTGIASRATIMRQKVPMKRQAPPVLWTKYNDDNSWREDQQIQKEIIYISCIYIHISCILPNSFIRESNN